MATTPRLSWNLRVTPNDQMLIDRAVSASGLIRTDFVLQAVRAAAQELLVEQPSKPEQWDRGWSCLSAGLVAKNDQGAQVISIRNKLTHEHLTLFGLSLIEPSRHVPLSERQQECTEECVLGQWRWHPPCIR